MCLSIQSIVVFVQSLSCVQLFVTSWTAVCLASKCPSLAQTHVHWVGNAIPFCPLFLFWSSFPSIRIFSNESALHSRWLEYWHFSFSISSFNEYSGLLSFRIDWFDLAVQGTLRSLFQHHNLRASILRYSAFLCCSCHIYKWLLEKP